MIGKMIIGWVLKRWLWGVILAAALAYTGGVWVSGYNSAWKQAEVETLKARIASQQRDIDASRVVRKADQDAIARLETQAMEDEANYEALRCLLAQRPADAGRGLTQSELDLLLGKRANIDQHGGADDQPARPTGCPAPGGGSGPAVR